MNQKALKNIEIACKISNEEKYNYGYALILIQNKKYEKAIKILDILLEDEDLINVLNITLKTLD